MCIRKPAFAILPIAIAALTVSVAAAASDDYALFRLSFLDDWNGDVAQEDATNQVLDALDQIYTQTEARFQFEIRTGDTVPAHLCQYVSVPAGEPATEFERLITTTEFPPESELAIEKVDAHALNVQLLFRDAGDNEEPLSLDMDAWEMLDPGRTEQLRTRFCKVGDLLGWLAAKHDLHLRVLDAKAVKHFGIRVRGPEDQRYYGMRLAGVPETGAAAASCDCVRVDDGP